MEELSISSPHINFGDRNAAKILARKVNEDGAEVTGTVGYIS